MEILYHICFVQLYWRKKERKGKETSSAEYEKEAVPQRA
jgi:hypothetical protein